VSRTSRRALAPAAALVLALTACGGGDDDGLVAPTSSPAAGPVSPTPPPSASAAPSPSTQQDASAVAVYYVMDTTNGPRLYREFHSRPQTDAPVADALQAMFDVAPDDPDYSSLWPAGTEVLGASVEGGTATVDLSREALDGQAGSAFEAASVQQLVHTVTAADTSVQQVQLVFEGAPEQTLWGAVAVDEPVERAPQVEVLGPVWLLTPTEGGTIARGEQFGGVATAFEATVNWQWLQDGRVVAEGFSTATEGAPGRGEWSSTVEVPPGDYELKAFESSAEDGSETFLDTKTVTVTG
jgi:hypothetical protein